MAKNRELVEKLGKQLSAYSATAGIALAANQKAEAAIVYSGVQNIPFTGTEISIDLDSSVVSNFRCYNIENGDGERQCRISPVAFGESGRKV